MGLLWPVWPQLGHVCWVVIFAIFFYHIASLHVTDGLNWVLHMSNCESSFLRLLIATLLVFFHFLFTIISVLHIRFVLVNAARRKLIVYFYHAWQSLAKLTDLYWLDSVLLITCFVTYVLWWHHVASCSWVCAIFIHIHNKNHFSKHQPNLLRCVPCVIISKSCWGLNTFTTMMLLLGGFLCYIFAITYFTSLETAIKISSYI